MPQKHSSCACGKQAALTRCRPPCWWPCAAARDRLKLFYTDQLCACDGAHICAALHTLHSAERVIRVTACPSAATKTTPPQSCAPPPPRACAAVSPPALGSAQSRAGVSLSATARARGGGGRPGSHLRQSIRQVRIRLHAHPLHEAASGNDGHDKVHQAHEAAAAGGQRHAGAMNAVLQRCEVVHHCGGCYWSGCCCRRPQGLRSNSNAAAGRGSTMNAQRQRRAQAGGRHSLPRPPPCAPLHYIGNRAAWRSTSERLVSACMSAASLLSSSACRQAWRMPSGSRRRSANAGWPNRPSPPGRRLRRVMLVMPILWT